MEMQGVYKEGERSEEDGGASKPKPEVKTEEEAEDPYSKLHNPSEDIYSEAIHRGTPVKARPGEQTNGNTRLYRAACLILTIICLVLLLVVVVLSMKLSLGREETTAAGKGGAPIAPTYSQEVCQALLAITKPEDPGCLRCPNMGLLLGRSCFFLSTFRLSWDESKKNCTARGGTLAIVNSLDVQNFLVEKGKMSAYWIGLRQDGTTWKWVDNTVLRESYWEDTQEADCGLLSPRNPPKKNWVTSPCHSVSYFICEMPI